MSSWLKNVILQKVSTGGHQGKERLDVLHKAIILSEKASTIYRRLPRNKENKVKRSMPSFSTD